MVDDVVKLLQEEPAALGLLGIVVGAIGTVFGGWMAKSREFRVAQADRLAEEGMDYVVYLDRKVQALAEDERRATMTRSDLAELKEDDPLFKEAGVRLVRAKVLIPPGIRTWRQLLAFAAEKYMDDPTHTAGTNYAATRSIFLEQLRSEVAARRGYWWRRVYRFVVNAVGFVLLGIRHGDELRPSWGRASRRP